MMLLLSPMVATFLILFHQDHCCKAVCVYCVLALCCTYEYQRKTLTRICTLQSSESWLISGAMHYCGKLANCRQLSENTVENSRRVFFDRLRGGTWWLTGSKPLTTKTTTCLIRTIPLIFANTYTIKERIMVNSRKRLEDHNCGTTY